MTNNTGPIIGTYDYGYEVVIQRKRTMKDAAGEMEREAMRKKVAEKSKAKCAES